MYLCVFAYVSVCSVQVWQEFGSEPLSGELQVVSITLQEHQLTGLVHLCQPQTVLTAATKEACEHLTNWWT